MDRFSYRGVIRAGLIAAIAAGAFTACSKEAKASRHLTRAEKYFKAGEYEKAKIEYSNVLQTDPKNAVAFRQLGLIWWEQGSPLRALPYLTKAGEIEPANANVRTKAAYAYGALRRIDDGRKEALAALQSAPGNEEALLFLIDTARTEEEVSVAQEAVKTGGKTGSTLEYLAAAHLATRKQDLPGAEAALKKAVESDPKSAAAHSALGNFLLRQGKVEDAGKEFKTSAELAPIRSPMRLKYAEFLVQKNERGEANATLDSLTSAAPDYLPAWNVRAQIAFADKKYDEAMGHLQKVFAIDQANFDARLIEGQTYLAKKDAKKAIEVLDGLDKTYPGIPPTKYNLARAHIMNGDAGQATAALSQAIAADPNYVEAIMLRAELDLRAGNAPQVVEALRDLVAKRPNLTQAKLLLAGGYQAAGQPEQARFILQEQVRQSPASPQAHLLLAFILRQQGKLAEARTSFEKAHELAPQNLVAFSQLVEMDVVEKNFEAAHKRVDEQLKTTPDLATAHLLKGQIYAMQKDWDPAETSLKRAIELDPGQAKAYAMLSGLYAANGKLPQALEQLDTLLQKQPDHTPTLMMAGLLHGRAKNPEKARDAYERLIARQPDFAPALNNLAYTYAEDLNDLPKARELARRARSIRSSDPAIADTFGWILYRSGEFPQAVAILREAAAGLSDNPEASYHFGMASYVMGDEATAKTALEKAANSTVDFPGKDQIAKRLTWLTKESKPSVDEIKAYLQTEPKDPVVWTRLGDVYQAGGASREAADAYGKAVESNPQFFPAMLELAKLYAGPLKEPGKALDMVKAARMAKPNDAAVSGALGRIVFEAGDFPLAYAMLQEGVAASPKNPDLQLSLAWAAYAIGQVVEARKSMEQVVALAADSPVAEEAREFLKWTAVGGPATNIAPEEIDAVIKAKPGYVPALMVRAQRKAEKGNRAAAIATYSGILQQYPKFAPAQLCLASLYLQSPDTVANAHELAVAAQKAMPEDVNAIKTLAVSSYHRKEFAGAVRLFEAAEARAPLGPEELFYLGMSRKQLKRQTASREALEKAVAAGLAEPMLGEAQKILNEDAK